MAELSYKTLGKFFLERVAERGSDTALREKDFGIWQRVSWDDYLSHVSRFALGLQSLGFQRGEHLAILSENCREWLYAELGVISLGGVMVGVYPTSPAPEVAYVVEHSRSKFVVCEDQEQTDKILEVESQLPLLEKIIVKDMKGMRTYQHDKIISFDEVEQLGEPALTQDPDCFRKEVELGKAKDVCMMIYTSGTTGNPKGAMISHVNIEATTIATAEALNATVQDSVVSYLPLCHVAEQILSMYLPLHLGYPVNFAESVATIQSDLREIAPTLFLGVPRIWEKLRTSILVGVRDASPFKRRIFNSCLAVGVLASEQELAGKRLGQVLRFKRWLAYLLVLRSLQNFVGMRKMRICFSAAAPISPEVLKFFHALGIRVKEGYGMTESTGLSFIHMGEDIRVGTVGKPLACIQYKLSPEGELLKHGPSIFVGYFRNEAATQETVVNGWLQTGDIAEVDEDGHVRIVDRKKDIIITSGGKNISPSLIENALRDSTYIKEAIVIGDGRKFLIALIQIEFENVGKWAAEERISYTNFKNLAQNERVRGLIAKDVDAVNAQFARVESIKKFVMLDKELDHDDDEMTATMKVRRKNIYKKFESEIETAYKS